MLSRKEIIDNILHDAMGVVSESLRDRVEALLHQKYAEICRMHPWQPLRRTTSLDFNTASGGTGLFLPANQVGVEYVIDESCDLEFIGRSRPDTVPGDLSFRYFTFVPDNTAAFEGEDIEVSSETSSFTSASLTTDATDFSGEYAIFDTNRGYYLLTSAVTPFTFTPTYYGETLTEEHFEIRPKFTQKMVLVDTNNDALENRSVTVHYWEAPEPLYRDSDRSILPSDDVLQLAVLAVLPEAKARRPVTPSMEKEALARAWSMNPEHPRTRPPRDVHNQRFRFDPNINYYLQRHNAANRNR